MTPMNPGPPIIIPAQRASQLLVRVDPDEFAKIVSRMKEPLIVVVEGGVFSTHYHYLTSYKGLPFYTRSGNQLPMPPGAEVVEAEEISIPD